MHLVCRHEPINKDIIKKPTKSIGRFFGNKGVCLGAMSIVGRIYLIPALLQQPIPSLDGISPIVTAQTLTVVLRGLG